MAEMDDSVVGACPPGRADDHKVCRLDSLPAEMEGRHHPEDGGTFRHSPARPPQKPCFGGWSEGGFDAAALHSQLADLLQLYLKRAAEPDAVQKCSAKDAISCAKTLTAMMTDVQSGKLSGNARRVVASKPASVDKNTEWPKMESRAEQIPNRVRGAHQRRSYGGDGAYVSNSRAGAPGVPGWGFSPRASLRASRASRDRAGFYKPRLAPCPA